MVSEGGKEGGSGEIKTWLLDLLNFEGLLKRAEK